MPRSKRDKKISLTKTEKKNLEWKQYIIGNIRHNINTYPHVYVFSVKNMRNNLLKDLRNEWKKHSRFVFGKKRLMQIAFGRTEAEEVAPGLHKLSEKIVGECGLLFTEKPESEIIEWAKDYWALEYARSGFTATETVVLPMGPLKDFAHSIEPHLRSLGMPTKLEKGVVTLYGEFTVCEKGKVLTPEQARILKLIAKPMAKFRLKIICSWHKEGGFVVHETEGEENDSGNEEGEDDQEDVDMEDDED